jgi:hypothetical protein
VSLLLELLTASGAGTRRLTAIAGGLAATIGTTTATLIRDIEIASNVDVRIIWSRIAGSCSCPRTPYEKCHQQSDNYHESKEHSNPSAAIVVVFNYGCLSVLRMIVL